MSKYRYKSNIIKHYSSLILIVILTLASAVTGVISNHAMDNLITSHTQLYPDMLNVIIKDNEELVKVFMDERLYDKVEDNPDYLTNFYSMGDVFRVKVWSKTGKILWSDDKNIIGKRFSDNIEFNKALAGETNYSVEKANSAENSSEIEAGKILEIYIPAIVDGQIIGVIELYERYDSLAANIRKMKLFLYVTVIVFGTILYILLFSIFYNAFNKLRNINHQLDKTKEVTLFAVASLAEARDHETGYHLKRTSVYVGVLANHLKKLNEYKGYITDSYIDDLVRSAPLHDIGKVGIRDYVLLKNGKLTDNEFEEMKSHCIIGAETLASAESKIDFASFLTIAKQITMHHHERWNGEGYPDGLIGDAIPISARMMALADVYDALRSVRPYKKSFSHEISRRIIIEGRGTHFDPQVVDAFIAHEQEFKETSEKYFETEYGTVKRFERI
ncbi:MULTISPECIES: HD-GYP domain-containing protein [unclassified Fusibacter]|uniref:HD-GYP domain-containing protein n=1 Tax=unclassified Fusibacter TaxID=2624464 RepID=UPI001010C369|nr:MULTISPECIES: HD domain-containing phosphohydrolase [unclassified Fusibacter]MCK8058232.1 HD domain-containing protein [Fusibacter sp. A2]NPE20815.1 HD domain-containing protein [Fusibacter sp. A1]RXV63019.1 HD domain-containing protein [Fusibacter sp. A1]